MMKRIFYSLLIISTVSFSQLSAKDQWGVGVAAGSPTIVFNALMPVGPFSLDLDIGWSFWSLFSHRNSFFSSLDLIFWEPEIASNLKFFVGAGPRFGFWQISSLINGEDQGGLFVGPRVPLGLDWQPINHLSLFFKIAPGLAFVLEKSLFSSNLSLDFGIGARYIF